MTGQEFRDLRVRAGLSIRLAAHACAVSPQTIQNWERAESPRIPAGAVDVLQAKAGEAGPARVAYAIGRLFAVLNGAAGDRLPKAWYTTCVLSPCRVLPQVLGYVRTNRPQQLADREEEIAALMRLIPESGFPCEMAEEEQGAFWLGYYHERGERSGSGL